MGKNSWVRHGKLMESSFHEFSTENSWGVHMGKNSWVLHGKLMELSIHGITMGKSYGQKLMENSWTVSMNFPWNCTLNRAMHLKPMEGSMDIPWKIQGSFMDLLWNFRWIFHGICFAYCQNAPASGGRISKIPRSSGRRSEGRPWTPLGDLHQRDHLQ